jgi:PAS domain S-box-containing protein
MPQLRGLVAAQDREGIRAALGDVLVRENRCELGFVANAKSEELWQAYRSPTDLSVRAPDPNVSSAVFARFTTFSGPRDSTRGVVVVKGDPLLVAARPVVDATGMIIEGVVIVGRSLSEDLLAGVIQQTGCKVSLSTDTGEFAGRMMEGMPWYVVRRTDKTIHVVTTLADMDGQAAVVVRVELPIEGVQQGLRASRFAMLSIVCTGVALLMLVLGLLETVVFSRIRRLESVIEQIGTSGDLSLRLPDSGRDEICHLSRNLNRMLSELESAENRMRESEQRYRSLFEGASDGILVLKDHRVVDCNAMAIRMFGHDKQQIVGHIFYRFLPPVQADGRESRREWSNLTDSVMREGSRLFEWRFRRLDGSVMDTEVIAARVSSGADLFVQVMIRDLTTRCEAEAEKRQLHAKMMQVQKCESLGVLAGGLAHDFNNMLVAVLGNAELALHEAPVGSPSRAYLEEIRKAAMRASELTNQMQAYSGKGQLSTQVVDISATVSEMTCLLQAVASKKVASGRFCCR